MYFYRIIIFFSSISDIQNIPTFLHSQGFEKIRACIETDQLTNRPSPLPSHVILSESPPCHPERSEDVLLNEVKNLKASTLTHPPLCTRDPSLHFVPFWMTKPLPQPVVSSWAKRRIWVHPHEHHPQFPNISRLSFKHFLASSKASNSLQKCRTDWSVGQLVSFIYAVHPTSLRTFIYIYNNYI